MATVSPFFQFRQQSFGAARDRPIDLDLYLEISERETKTESSRKLRVIVAWLGSCFNNRRQKGGAEERAVELAF
jgi:hypothetical protein